MGTSGRIPDYSYKRDWLPAVADEAAQPVSAAVTAVNAVLAPHKEDRPQSLDEWRAMVGVERAGREAVRWQAGGAAADSTDAVAGFAEVDIVSRGRFSMCFARASRDGGSM